MKKSSPTVKIATLISTALWVLSIIFALITPPYSANIWLPDTLLLAGFLPLLYVYSPSWPWLLFGALNLLIDFVLLLSAYASESSFPKDVITIKRHVADYHAPFVWLCFGILSLIYGIIRLAKNITFLAIKKKKK